MRIDKLTTQFQEALSDAQSLAVSADNPYIEPIHVLAAIIAQPDGSGRALLERAGVRISALRSSVEAALRTGRRYAVRTASRRSAARGTSI